ncbi:MAG: hypothetical protein ACRBDL_05085 [Alphaproteobacteria bacterium]
MKNFVLFTVTLTMLSGCGFAGRTLGTATKILTSPISLTENESTLPTETKDVSIAHAYTE